MKKTLLLTSAIALFAAQASAVEVQPYVGADFVYTWADVKNSSYIEDHYRAGNFSLGAMISSNWGLELSYQQALQNKKNSKLGQTKTEYKVYGLDGVGYLPVTSNVQALFGVGLGYYEIKTKYKDASFGHKEDSHYGLRTGAGLQYNINDNLAARMMLRYHYIDTDVIDQMTDLTVGVRYYF